MTAHAQKPSGAETPEAGGADRKVWRALTSPFRAIGRVLGFGKTRSMTSIATTETTDAPKTEAVVVTLNPEIIQRKDVESLGSSIDRVAAGYKPGAMLLLFDYLEKAFTMLFAEYRRHAIVKLEEARNAWKTVGASKAIDADAANEALMVELKPLAAKRLDLIDATRAKGDKNELRRIHIGITGNPAVPVLAASVGLAAILPVAAAFAIALYFEIVFNAPILQNQGNRNMALAFSLAVSLAGSITTYFAGASKREELNHRNAEAQKKSTFPKGIDPMTGNKVEVFPMSADADFKRRLWHTLMGIVIVGTLTIRYFMMTQLGDVAGSFGVVLVFLVLYAWEAMFAEVTHPRTAEYQAKKKEVEGADAEIKKLEGDIVSPEMKSAIDKYNSLFSASPNPAYALAQTFRRLASEFLASPAWYDKAFANAAERLVVKVGDTISETDDEVEAIYRQVEPKFTTDGLPFDLASEMQTAGATPATIEVQGRRMAAKEVEGHLVTITGELVKDRAAKAEVRRLEVIPPRGTWKPTPIK